MKVVDALSGMHRKEVRVVAICAPPFFTSLLLFPAHSLSDKGGKRDDGGRNKYSPEVDVCRHGCTFVLVFSGAIRRQHSPLLGCLSSRH